MSDGQPRPGSLRAQLSGALSGSGLVGGGHQLEPALRAALVQPRSGTTLSPAASFAAWAALDPGRPEATLAMFRRLSNQQGRQQGGAERGGGKSGTPPSVSDSARQTESEAEASSPASPGSSLAASTWSGGRGSTADAAHASAEAGAGSAEPRSRSQAAEQHERRQHSDAGGLRSASAFAPAAARQFSGPPLPRGVTSPPPPPRRQVPPGQGQEQQAAQLRAELLKQLPSAQLGLHPALSASSAHSSAADTAYFSTRGAGPSSSGAWEQQQQGYHPQQWLAGMSGGGTGADTPRSAVSWVSAVHTLPQTEAELAQMDLHEVEQLAAEAAELQQRASLALRLAQQRMQGRESSGSGEGSAVEGGSAVAAQVGSSGSAEGSTGGGGSSNARSRSAEWQSYLPGGAPPLAGGTHGAGSASAGHEGSGSDGGGGSGVQQAAVADVAQAEGAAAAAAAAAASALAAEAVPVSAAMAVDDAQGCAGADGGTGAGSVSISGTNSADWQSYVPGTEFPPADNTRGASAGHGSGGGDSGIGGAGQQAVADVAQDTAAAARGAAEPAVRPWLSVAVQLCFLLATLAEAALLGAASMAQRAMGGRLQLPRRLVLAPASAMRGAALAAAIAVELLLRMVAALRQAGGLGQEFFWGQLS